MITTTARMILWFSTYPQIEALYETKVFIGYEQTLLIKKHLHKHEGV